MVYLDGIIFSLQRTGGISVYFKTLLDYLSSNDCAATLLLDENVLQDHKLGEGSISSIRKRARILERYRSCRVPKDAKVFHSSYYRQPLDRTKASVVTVHDFIYERFSKGPRRWVHSAQKLAAIRSAQDVICVSHATKSDLLHFVGETPGQNIHVIHNGVSKIFHQSGCVKPQVPFVLFVGERRGYKNFKLVLDSMYFLPEFELHCVGGGPIHPSELVGVHYSILERVKHLGFVTDSELNGIYNQASCLVYPSSYEGFGIPVIEAMSAGCPVISTDCSAVKEIGQNALTVVSELDPKLMAEAILRTLSSERSAIISRGLAVASNYCWENSHRQTLQIYRNLGG